MRYKQDEFKREYVELGGSSKRYAESKRKIKVMTASAAALTVFCISVAAGMASVPEMPETPDLSEYKYTEDGETDTAPGSIPGNSVSDEKTAAVTSPDIPSVTLPAAAPAENSAPDQKSASVTVGSARMSSPAAYDVRIMADGESYYVTASGTVEDALEKTGLELGRYDIVTPSLDSSLNDQTVITVQRVKYSRVTTSQRIPYETEYYDDDTLEMGETRIVTYGRDGSIIRKYRVKRIDGEIVSKELISEEIGEDTVNEVIANGTYISGTDGYEYEEPDGGYSYDIYFEEDYDGGAVHASLIGSVSEFEVPADLYLDRNGEPLKYIETLHGKSCAYTAEEGALMSTGKCVEQGYVAVNPQIIPYGSRLYIVADDGEVYGYAIAADTGGSVGRNDILVDLFMWSYDECIQWGAKDVTIYVLDYDGEE